MSDIEIKAELLKLQDKKYAEFNAKLCQDTYKKILGIRIPVLKKLAKKLVHEEKWKQIIEKIDEEYFEETMLKFFLIAYAPISIEEKLVYVEKFIFEIDSWAITDSFVPALKIKSEEREVF